MRWFFRSLHPIQYIKKGSKFFSHVVQIFTELGQVVNILAHMENTQATICNCIFSLRALI